MAVIVQYIVERNGVQKMTFTDKKEADQYDKMLDIAETLYEYIDAANLPLSEESLEPLSLFLAENSTEVTNLLKGSKPKKPKAASASKADKGDDEKAVQENEKPEDGIVAGASDSFESEQEMEQETESVEVA